MVPIGSAMRTAMRTVVRNLDQQRAAYDDLAASIERAATLATRMGQTYGHGSTWAVKARATQAMLEAQRNALVDAHMLAGARA